MNKEIIISLVIVSIITMMLSGSFLLSMANGQSQPNNTTTEGQSRTTQKPLPVLLIHGYASDASVWTRWEDLLKKMVFDSI
jgi:uncharacterized alpha/beta hydrolase family protein